MTRARQATVGSFDPATHSGTLLLDDGTPLTFDATATDPDLPANTLTFALVSVPPGLTATPVDALALLGRIRRGDGIDGVDARDRQALERLQGRVDAAEDEHQGANQPVDRSATAGDDGEKD